MPRTGLIVAVLLFVLGVLWWLAMPSANAPLASTGEQEVEPDEPALPEPVAPSPPKEPAATPKPVSAEGPPEPKAAPEPQPAEQPPPLEAPIPPPEPSGPIDELKQRFRSEPRDASGEAAEAVVRKAFSDKEVDRGLLKSVLCRRSICRLEINWSSPRHMGYVIAMTRLASEFRGNLAISPVDPPTTDRPMLVEVYWPRAQEDAPTTP
jgi:hypothetical protein